MPALVDVSTVRFIQTPDALIELFVSKLFEKTPQTAVKDIPSTNSAQI